MEALFSSIWDFPVIKQSFFSSPLMKCCQGHNFDFSITNTINLQPRERALEQQGFTEASRLLSISNLATGCALHSASLTRCLDMVIAKCPQQEGPVNVSCAGIYNAELPLVMASAGVHFSVPLRSDSSG